MSSAVPDCPRYLDGALAQRYSELAPELARIGTLDKYSIDLLAKYLLAENEYIKVSSLLHAAISRGDGDDANKWIAAQDRLTKQILTLGAELGITPQERRKRGYGRK